MDTKIGTLIKQLRPNGVIGMHGFAVASGVGNTFDARMGVETWLRYVRDGSHFIISPEAMERLASEESWERAQQMTATLARTNTLRLPFPEVIVEMETFNSNTNAVGRTFVRLNEMLRDNGVIVFSAVSIDLYGSTVSLSPFGMGFTYSHRHKGWGTLAGRPPFVNVDSMVRNTSDLRATHLFDQDALEEQAHIGFQALMGTIMAFYDRSFKRIAVDPPRGKAKMVGSNKHLPMRRHIRVDVDAGYQYSDDRKGSQGSGRKQPLHQRSGSWRTYWTGPKRQMATLRFVESYVAGDPAYGTIDHSYEKNK